MVLDYSGSGEVYFDKRKYKCDLYLNREYGKVLINISVDSAFANFLELPVKISFLSGMLSTGYKFILLDCNRNNTTGLVSQDITKFSYYAEYMIEGIGGEEVNSIEFYKVRFELSNIINWGNISGYMIDGDMGIKNNENIEEPLYVSEEFEVKYVVKKSLLPSADFELLRGKIELNQSGNIDIIFKENKSINDFVDIIKKVKRLIEIATLNNVYIKKIIAWNHSYYNIYGEIKYEISISIISSEINQIDDEEKNNNSIKFNSNWLKLPELLKNRSFYNYFEKYEKIEPIIELYIQIIESKDMSYSRYFLNVVQALEIYHSRFKASSIEEFKDRIDNVILKDRPEPFLDNDRNFLMANSRRFVTLESRIADLLLADFNIHFDTGNIDYLDFPKVIADTRNYYIHYDEKIKDERKILSNEELKIYIGTLMYMLEYYVMLEIGFSNYKEIKEKLNSRWSRASLALELKEISKEKFRKDE